jgi:hypothetical protein
MTNVLNELAISVCFVTNEPSDVMNDGVELAFLGKISFNFLWLGAVLSSLDE